MVDEHDRSDAALDRLITEALDVQVAPEFVARVRTQMAQERAHRSWRGARALVPVAAVGALAVVWLAYPFDRPVPLPDAVTTGPVVVALAPAIESSPALTSAPVAMDNTTAAPVSATPAEGRVEPPRPTVATEPAVIVDAREARAFEALIARVREGRLDASQFRAPQAAAEELHTAEIVIPPLPVPLLAFSADIHKAAQELE